MFEAAVITGPSSRKLILLEMSTELDVTASPSASVTVTVAPSVLASIEIASFGSGFTG
jgi:hypothetical protein